MTDKLPIELTTEAIVEALREAGVPQRIIAQRLLLPSSAVSNVFNGKRRFTLEEANKILDLIPAAPTGRSLPVIGMAGAGNWIEAIEHARDQVWVPSQAAEGKFAVEVVGQSMNLVLPEGSLAIIDPEDKDLCVGKLYLLRNGDGEATIKRFRIDPARFEPVSDDPTFVPFKVGAFDFQIIGRVTYAMQRF